MTAEELKSITEAVSQALTARQAPVTPPGPPIQPLSAMPSMMPQTTGPIGVAVAITIPLPDGSEASAYITVPTDCLHNLPQTIAMLQQQGWPVRCYRPKPAWGNAGWGQRNNYGGWRR